MKKLSLAAALLAALALASPAGAQTKPKKTTTTAPATKPAPAAQPAPAAKATPAPVTAVAGPTMHNQISIWGILAYRYAFSNGYGLGARYQYVIVPEGVLKLSNGIRDEIGIEGGLDFTNYSWDYGYLGADYGYSYNRFDVVVGATWNFWLTPKIAVYPKLDVGFGFGSVSSDLSGDVYDPSVDPLFFQGALGVVYKLDRVFLRAELGSAMLRLGASFTF